MRKRWSFIIMLAVLFIPQTVLAHSKLVNSNPIPNSTVTQDVKELRLEYNTKVERGEKI